MERVMKLACASLAEAQSIMVSSLFFSFPPSSSSLSLLGLSRRLLPWVGFGGGQTHAVHLR